ncbi:MAG: alpha-amylase [Chlorobiaceae bacterium]|nr:alpha-amylase [Chlorobiaceae bacterium]
MKIKQNHPVFQNKEHFYVNRSARELFHLTDPDFLALPLSAQESFLKTEKQASIINDFLKKQKGTDAKPVLPAQLHGMKLLHELFHYILSKSLSAKQPDLLDRVNSMMNRDLSDEKSSEYLKKFLTAFPPLNVFQEKVSPENWLQRDKSRTDVIEESFLVWLNNQNPALEQFSDFLSDSEIMHAEAFGKLIRNLQNAMHAMGPVGPGDADLVELLFRPIRHAPSSVLEQLRYIRLNWGDILKDSPFWVQLAGAIEFIEDEDKYLFFEKITLEEEVRQEGQWFEKKAQIPDYTSLDYDNAPAHYSLDSSWMPEVVMLAKSTYVWLDQLSKRYRKAVNRLQDIPDEELDLMADRGFTALWLIGLWQRSTASQKIKQMHGNPEAKASAYSLEKYDISDDIGGYEGYENLRNRARLRGIRLASDMVPNHTGMDSELVRNKPDWFLSAWEPPYFNYSYTGPNLSNDPRYGIFLEDGYWNRSDAAVTFKRVDYMNGDTRYIYHGNDGTNMPWNDTAQLNFLSAEVREGVIQQILHVARMFPVIRFDAAMVLAKRHIQRLWFPLPGHSAAVPSRSGYAMSMSDFDAAIPEEFWREVVDRIQKEVPDTLLLAEAFWMLEGYFVRTLGMHRVYNSAFMHMLKKEDNTGYRYLIKNTLEFDPEILKRYVNFMNNPDEDTAIAQFGRGDKYFGVCMMMITMPGLPMFGHGQVEGFTEKYGMEYAKAYYDEQPDEHLVERHYHEIFPILKKRPLFAEVHNFFLYDVFSPEGAVNENIFAYSNRREHETALVVFNNSFERALGWIRTSVGYLHDGRIMQCSLGEGLNLDNGDNSFVIFRDHASGLEFIRPVRVIHEKGLLVALEGYKYNVFLDFRTVQPSRFRPYDRLCHELNGSGTASIERAALEMSFAPFHQSVVTALGNLPQVKRIAALQEEDTMNAFGESVASLLEKASLQLGEFIEKPLEVTSELVARAPSMLKKAASAALAFSQQPESRKLLAALGLTATDGKELPQLLMHWILLGSLQELLAGSEALNSNIIDDCLLHDALATCYPEKGIVGIRAGKIPDLIACMLSLRPSPLMGSPEEKILANLEHLLRDNRIRMQSLLQFDERHGRTWFREHPFTVLVSWIALYLLIESRQIPSGKQKEASDTSVTGTWIEAIGNIEMKAFLAGYETGEFFGKQG